MVVRVRVRVLLVGGCVSGCRGLGWVGTETSVGDSCVRLLWVDKTGLAPWGLGSRKINWEAGVFWGGFLAIYEIYGRGAVGVGLGADALRLVQEFPPTALVLNAITWLHGIYQKPLPCCGTAP